LITKELLHKPFYPESIAWFIARAKLRLSTHCATSFVTFSLDMAGQMVCCLRSEYINFSDRLHPIWYNNGLPAFRLSQMVSPLLQSAPGRVRLVMRPVMASQATAVTATDGDRV